MHNDWQAGTNPRLQYLYTTKQSSLTEKKVKINQEAEPYRYNNFFDELKKNISLKTAFLSHPNIYSGDHQVFRIIEKKKSHIFLHITIMECVTWKSMDTSTVNTLKCFMHNIQLHLCTQKIQLRNGLTVYGRTSHFLEHADFCGKIQISFLFGVLSPPAG